MCFFLVLSTFLFIADVQKFKLWQLLDTGLRITKMYKYQKVFFCLFLLISSIIVSPNTIIFQWIQYFHCKNQYICPGQIGSFLLQKHNLFIPDNVTSSNLGTISSLEDNCTYFLTAFHSVLRSRTKIFSFSCFWCLLGGSFFQSFPCV